MPPPVQVYPRPSMSVLEPRQGQPPPPVKVPVYVTPASSRVFPEIQPHGLTSGEAKYGGLQALIDFQDTINRSITPQPGSPRARGLSEGIVLGTYGDTLGSLFPDINFRFAFSVIPPFIGAEVGTTTIYKVLGNRTQGTPPRIVVSYGSADLGLGVDPAHIAKGKVPTTGFSLEVKVLGQNSPELQALIQKYPEEFRALFALPSGPEVRRDELLAQGRALDAAILFPKLMGQPIGHRPIVSPPAPPPLPPPQTRGKNTLNAKDP